jgi:hypothetical protein
VKLLLQCRREVTCSASQVSFSAMTFELNFALARSSTPPCACDASDVTCAEAAASVSVQVQVPSPECAPWFVDRRLQTSLERANTKTVRTCRQTAQRADRIRMISAMQRCERCGGCTWTIWPRRSPVWSDTGPEIWNHWACLVCVDLLSRRHPHPTTGCGVRKLDAAVDHDWHLAVHGPLHTAARL